MKGHLAASRAKRYVSTYARAGCNIRLVEALAQDLPIFFDHVVTGIDYCEGGVAVHTAQQTFTGAALPMMQSIV